MLIPPKIIVIFNHPHSIPTSLSIPSGPPRQYRTRTMLCMPIRDNYANVVAVVQAINKLDGVFTMTDELLLTSVAIQARFQMAGNHFRQLQASMLEIIHHAFFTTHHTLSRVEYQALFFHHMSMFAKEELQQYVSQPPCIFRL